MFSSQVCSSYSEYYCFKTLFPNHDTYARFSDEEDEISHASRIRGFGGVAILWDNSISTFIKRLPDGNQRIVAIQIEAKPKPICLINVYLPSRGKDQAKTKYMEALDSLREMIIKYRDTHLLIIGGDMNGSLFRKPENDHDKALKSFMAEQDLIIPKQYPETATFFYHDGKASATIDYFITPRNQTAESIGDIQNMGLQPLNTSDHSLIMGKIKVEKMAKKHPKPYPTK